MPRDTPAVAPLPQWFARGACVGTLSDAFVSERLEDAAIASKVCAGCPVRAPCGEFGRAEGLSGVYGGQLLVGGVPWTVAAAKAAETRAGPRVRKHQPTFIR